MVRYGEFLGALHGKTSEYSEKFKRIRQQVGINHHPRIEHIQVFQNSANVVMNIPSRFAGFLQQQYKSLSPN